MEKILFLFSDVKHFGSFSGILDIFSLLSIVGAVVIIIIKNPIACVMSLIFLFSAVSCYLIFTGLGFIGLVYLLVYVGAVSILFLFILMLINIRVSELVSETKNSIPLVFLITFVSIFANVVFFYNTLLPADKPVNIDNMSIITINSWEDLLRIFDHIASVGNIMFTVYAILLIIVSYLLLLAMVGAIAITVKQELSKYLITEHLMHSSLFTTVSSDFSKAHHYLSPPLQGAIFTKSGITALIKFIIIMFTGLIVRGFIDSDLAVCIFAESGHIVSWLCYLVLAICTLYFDYIPIPNLSNFTHHIPDFSIIHQVKRPGSPLEGRAPNMGKRDSTWTVPVTWRLPVPVPVPESVELPKIVDNANSGEKNSVTLPSTTVILFPKELLKILEAQVKESAGKDKILGVGSKIGFKEGMLTKDQHAEIVRFFRKDIHLFPKRIENEVYLWVRGGYWGVTKNRQVRAKELLDILNKNEIEYKGSKKEK